MTNEKPYNEEDRRVKRTKKILRDSLLKLLEEKPVSKISVKELTGLAGVNRSTFYFYYKDIVDMVSCIQDEIFMQFRDEVLSHSVNLLELDDFTSYISKFLTFIKNNSEVCRFAVSNDIENALSNRIKAALLEQIPDTKALFAPTDPRYYITLYGISGIWQTILEWMYDGMVIPPDEFALFLSRAYFFGGRTVVKDPDYQE